ncbi:MAG: hypothetical protein WD851_22880 [Pirellulales bacterium]
MSIYTSPSHRLFRLPPALVALALIIGSSALAFDTIGNGYGSKWGADPVAGTGAVVTWGYMLDGTGVDPNFRIDPFGLPDISGVVGTSNITELRNLIEANHGAGSFDAAIQRAFDTWSAVANITFVGPVPDTGLDVDSPSAIYPNIRIGAFQPDPNHWFKDTGSIGFGPPGPPNEITQFPLSGDVFFNLARPAQQSPFHIAPGDEDVTPVDVFNFGDDLEGLFLHELGHAAIGLDHPRWDGEDPDRRLMYVGDFQNPNAPFCCTAINRQLHPDDIAAARYVYGVRGDYNHDRVVDAADYVVWRDAIGTESAGLLAMDGDADGTIGQDDHAVWFANFGLTSPVTEGPLGTGLTAVPEPAKSTYGALIVGAVVILRFFNRRRLRAPAVA